MGKFGAISTALAIFALAMMSPGGLQAQDSDKDVTNIVLFGDSIAAGYGLPPEDGLAQKLEDALHAANLNVTLQRAGVSGDTTAGGLARLDWSINLDADLVILVLGGNDALRAIPAKQTANNLDALVKGLTERGVAVLLTGMRAPPNLGPEYAAEFEPIFADVAARYEATFYPFILDGVAANPMLNQADGIHPNAQGVDIIVDGLLPYIVALMDR